MTATARAVAGGRTRRTVGRALPAGSLRPAVRAEVTDMPFSARTNPVQVLFAVFTGGGDHVSLRVPAQHDPACCCCDTDGVGFMDGQVAAVWWLERSVCTGDGTLDPSGPSLFGDPDEPEDSGQPEHHDCGPQPRCGCGAARFVDVVGLLDNDQIAPAFTAHLDMLTELTRHLAGLRAADAYARQLDDQHAADGRRDDTAAPWPAHAAARDGEAARFGAATTMCVGCVTDPEEHEFALDAVIDELSRDLADSMFAANVTLHAELDPDAP